MVRVKKWQIAVLLVLVLTVALGILLWPWAKEDAEPLPGVRYQSAGDIPQADIETGRKLADAYLAQQEEFILSSVCTKLIHSKPLEKLSQEEVAVYFVSHREYDDVDRLVYVYATACRGSYRHKDGRVEEDYTTVSYYAVAVRHVDSAFDPETAVVRGTIYTSLEDTGAEIFEVTAVLKKGYPGADVYLIANIERAALSESGKTIFSPMVVFNTKIKFAYLFH